MSNTFECEPANDIVKLLQITDPHLFKDTSKELLDLCLDVIYHKYMKAFGLHQLILLYIQET